MSIRTDIQRLYRIRKEIYTFLNEVGKLKRTKISEEMFQGNEKCTYSCKYQWLDVNQVGMLNSHHWVYSLFRLYDEIGSDECLHMVATCHYRAGNIDQAYHVLQVKDIPRTTLSRPSSDIYTGVYRYFELKIVFWGLRHVVYVRAEALIYLDLTFSKKYILAIEKFHLVNLRSFLELPPESALRNEWFHKFR